MNSGQGINTKDLDDYFSLIDSFINEFEGIKELQTSIMVLNNDIIKNKKLESFIKKLNINQHKTYRNKAEIEEIYNQLSNTIKAYNLYNNITSVMKKVYKKYDEKLIQLINGNNILNIIQELDVYLVFLLNQKIINQHKSLINEYEKEKKNYEKGNNFKNNFKDVIQPLEDIRADNIDEIMNRIDKNIKNIKKVNALIDRFNDLSDNEKDTDGFREFKNGEYSPEEFNRIEKILKSIKTESETVSQFKEEMKLCEKYFSKEDMERIKKSKHSGNVIDNQKAIREEVIVLSLLYIIFLNRSD